MDFPERKDINIKEYTNNDYKSSLLNDLQTILKDVDTNKWKEDPEVKINQIEKQKEFFWIRIYLKQEDEKLKKGDTLNITYTPYNESLEVIFGSYEKRGVNRNHEDEIINFITEEDKKILCCMVDKDKVNSDSENIPNLRTLFRNSKYYRETIFRKDELIIEFEDYQYEYGSLSL
jgi:hypothetical protein